MRTSGHYQEDDAGGGKSDAEPDDPQFLAHLRSQQPRFGNYQPDVGFEYLGGGRSDTVSWRLVAAGSCLCHGRSFGDRGVNAETPQKFTCGARFNVELMALAAAAQRPARR